MPSRAVLTFALVALALPVARADDAVEAAPRAPESSSPSNADAFSLTYLPLPASARPQLRVVGPSGLAVRISDAGEELVREAVPTAIEAAPGQPLRVEVRSAQGVTVLDRLFEVRAGHVAQVSIVTPAVQTPTITMTRAPATSDFASVVNSVRVQPIIAIGGPQGSVLLGGGAGFVPLPTTPTQITPAPPTTPPTTPPPAPAAPVEIAPAAPTVTTRAAPPKPPPPAPPRAPIPPPPPQVKCLAAPEF